jgi:hypothetical protein
MELTLNLVWVCVAIAGILVQIVTSATAPRTPEGPSPSRKIVAMGCALVILFFVISMTDDLHDQVLVFEESKLSRVSAGARASAHAASNRVPAFPLLGFFPLTPFSLPPLTAARRPIQQFALRFAAASERAQLCGRAPPTHA